MTNIVTMWNQYMILSQYNAKIQCYKIYKYKIHNIRYNAATVLKPIYKTIVMKSVKGQLVIFLD
jgi:AAA15 family ATPase/GTPase